jgi:hypothetical protein
MDEHKDLIRKLLNSGMTQAEVGKCLGKSQAWVCAVLAGEFKDIKWGEGIRLRQLVCERGIAPKTGEQAR